MLFHTLIIYSEDIISVNLLNQIDWESVSDLHE